MARFFIFAAVFLLTMVICNAKKIPLVGTDADLFDKFEKIFAKKFSNPSEKAKRKGIFAKNLLKIKLLNLQNPQTEFGITEFSDMTEDEFKNHLMQGDMQQHFASMNLTKEDPHQLIRQKRAVPPVDFDWRNTAKVTAVRNQGSCGCCWSFASVAAIESHYAIRYNQLIALSDQQLLDCDTVNMGCNGGWPYYAMQYVIRNGLKLHNNYGYSGVKSTCRATSAPGYSYYISSFTQLSTDENYLMNYIFNYGPVTMCFTFPSTMQHYVSGIVSLTASQCEAQKSGAHAVTLVGFGTQNGVPFFAAKNSWGLNWGENGFFRFRRNLNFCNFTQNLVAPIF